MQRTLWSPWLAVVLSAFAWAAPKGTAPRSDASQYPSHAEQGGISIGAKLLTSAEVRKAFVADLNRCCVVVEFAIFPDAGKPVPVSRDDLILRISGSETSTKASGPALVSAALQKSPGQQRDVSVHGETGIGFEIGPYERGTYKEAGSESILTVISPEPATRTARSSKPSSERRACPREKRPNRWQDTCTFKFHPGRTPSISFSTRSTAVR